MAKVITFSRTFPAYHPKAGQPTYFVEKIWKSLGFSIEKHSHKNDIYPKLEGFEIIHKNKIEVYYQTCDLLYHTIGTNHPSIISKHHTIRAGSRWKAGDYFSPRVWSGKPYNSKQIIIAPDIEIKKVWDFDMDLNGIYSINGKYISEQDEYNLATNDGLSEANFQFWFMPNMNKPKPFSGQIICWNDNVEY